jgi:hypothetical protein
VLARLLRLQRCSEEDVETIWPLLQHAIHHGAQLGGASESACSSLRLIEPA